MNPKTRNVVLSLIVLFTSANLSAATRYIVGLRGPLHSAKVPMVRDADVAEMHDVRRFENFNSFAAELTDEEVTALRASREVRYVEPVHERHLLDATAGTPAAASDGTRYNFEQTVPPGIALTHAPDLWTLARNVTPVNVVIIDTGIDPTHPDIAANYAGGYNTLVPANPPLDDHGHGTHVAGTVAAADNSIGVVGMAPHARLWAAKVLDASGTGSTENVVAALDWVISKSKALGGHWIVSLSLGSNDVDFPEREAFQRSYDAGILAVAATGNKNQANLEFPGAYPTVLSVGALDEKSVRATFSNYGPNIGVMAPGVRVLSTTRVGTNALADVQTDTNVTLTVTPVFGSPKQDVSAPFVYCGIGNPADFPPSVHGKIAVIARGCGLGVPLVDCNFTFHDKVKNAMDAGAVAAIIYNLPDEGSLSGWTLIRRECDQQFNCSYYQPDLDFPWILVTAMSYPDAQTLLNGSAHSVTESYRFEDYLKMSGTSMATPHVSGGAALIWSLASNATAQDVRNAIISGTKDLGQPGYDPLNGYGMLDVLASAKLLAPQLFGAPAPAPAPKRRPN
jgi:serine protease